MLVIPTKAYAKKVPVMVSSKIIDRAMNVISNGSWPWQQWCGDRSTSVQFSLGHSSCPTNVQEGTEPLLKGHLLPQAPAPLHIRSFAWTMSRATSTPLRRSWSLHLRTVNVHSKTDVSGHCMWVHMLAELVESPQLPTSVVPTAMCAKLYPGSSPIANLSEQAKCLPHHDPCEGHCLGSCSCQLGATGGPQWRLGTPPMTPGRLRDGS